MSPAPKSGSDCRDNRAAVRKSKPPDTALRFPGSGGLLFGQRLLEGLLSISDKILIACRVDKDTGAILRIVLQFREQIEIPAVRSKKYVTGQSPQHGKCMLEVLNNAGIAYGVVGCRDEVLLRPKACSSDDDNVARRSRWLPWEVRAHGPCSASARVAGSLKRR